ncbi:hypothetical protein TNCV_3604571 [Trichonephila clavipes]|nr:hypothetical protein TNCV_3604571 [Trichonephila clavipes]
MSLYSEGSIETFTTESPHMDTIFQIESGFVPEGDLMSFDCIPIISRSYCLLNKPRLRRTDSVESKFMTVNKKTWRTKVNERPTRSCLAGYDDDDECIINN